MAKTMQTTRTAVPPVTPAALLLPTEVRSRFDFGTVFGLITGFGLILAAIAISGTITSFVNLPGLLIVFGGTFAVTAVSYSPSDLAQAARALGTTLIQRERDVQAAANQMLHLVEVVRRQNVLAIEQLLPRFRREPFLQKALTMVVDGSSGDQIERVMRQEMRSAAARHEKTIGVLRRAAEAAPAMGLIGTLVGLVQMLGHLQDPTSIGPTMAVALLTTFYGAVLAHVVFAPLASKLEQNSADENLIKNVYIAGATAMGRRENPRHLEMMLNSILPPSLRVRHFD